MGPEARKREFNADHIIKNGPYKFLKHPLYIGNFFLVFGVVLLFNPPRWLGFLYMAAFVVMYTLIAVCEREFLKGKPTKDVSYKFNNLKGEFSTGFVLLVIYAVFFVLLRRG